MNIQCCQMLNSALYIYQPPPYKLSGAIYWLKMITIKWCPDTIKWCLDTENNNWLIIRTRNHDMSIMRKMGNEERYGIKELISHWLYTSIVNHPIWSDHVTNVHQLVEYSLPGSWPTAKPGEEITTMSHM